MFSGHDTFICAKKKKEKDWGGVLESGLLLEHGGDVKRVCLS